MSATKKNNLVITDILLLQQQLRSKLTLAELGHFLVNDSQKIAPYQLAVFYRHFRGHRNIEAISGIPMPVKEAPFYIWLKPICKQLVSKNLMEPSIIKKEGKECFFSAEEIRGWDEFLPQEVLWLPLLSADGECLGGLLLARSQSWQADELRLLQYWGNAIAYSVELLSHKKHAAFAALKNVKTVIWASLVVVLVAILLIPIPLSVLAQAEVVPKNPMVVRAPLKGVIKEVLALPNKAVVKGSLLVRLDDTELQSRLDVATQELEIAKAEYRRAQQSSILDSESSAEIPMLAARIEQRYTEVNYVKSLLKRINIHAERSGVAIVPDVYELEGKPVQLGERLLTLANAASAELEMWLAVGDSIELPKQAQVELFLNVSPEISQEAQLNYVNFQAEMSPEGLFAFRARADFPVTTTPPRIGLRGTAKIYGASVPLYYYLFRRPFAAARQWLGL
ncbi:MAG: hypothetical protein Q9M50_03900 [Methylococcales bacterium]|nr:hypothetical protein [Methylococcales bacterium]